MSGHVFISHGSEDRDEANALCALIESRGVTAWMAPRDVRPGLDYSEALQAAIEGCAAFVVLVTDQANTSPYVRAETEMAFSNSKPIFPVRTSDIKPAAGLAFFLKIRHWTDAYGKERDANLNRLALELQALSGAAPDQEAEEMAQPRESPNLPASPVAIPAIPAELLAAAIGPNADWYLARWRRMDEKKTPISWSWAACFLSIFWMAYRKMWLWLALLLAANLVLGIVGSASPLLGRITLFATIGLSFVSGYLAVGWYRKQVGQLVAQTSGLEREAALAQLGAKGGVSKPALWILIAIAALLFVLTAFAAVVEAQRQLKQEQLRQQQLRDHENALREAPPPVDAGEQPDPPPPEQEEPPAD